MLERGISRIRFRIRRRVIPTLVLLSAVLPITYGYAAFIKQGTEALKHREYDLAIVRFSSAIALVPAEAEAWSLRGEAYALKGDHDRAAAGCDRAIKLALTSGEAYRRCGLANSEEKNYREAIPYYATALKFDQRNAAAWMDRGVAYFHLGQTDRAISDYDRALELDLAEQCIRSSRQCLV